MVEQPCMHLDQESRGDTAQGNAKAISATFQLPVLLSPPRQ